MNPFNPYSYVFLRGDSVMRGVTLEIPSDRLKLLLPYGLELGAQTVTRPGTHPVILLFNEMLAVHMTIPSLLPSMSYRELSFGIPHCYLGGTKGPFYYQPRLFLDSLLATLGGVLYWGFPKRLAEFSLSGGDFAVSSRGTSLTSLKYADAGSELPFSAYPNFDSIRAMHDQPLVLMLPAGVGPFFVCSNFDKLWDQGTLQPLQTTARIESSYLPGLETGSFDAPSIADSVVGSYVMRVPWRLSMPYSPHAAQ